MYERHEVIVEQINFVEILKDIKLGNLLDNFVSEGGHGDSPDYECK